MNETFYLSNVVPQNYENNAGFWNRFEIYCRELVCTFLTLSGSLILNFRSLHTRILYLKHKIQFVTVLSVKLSLTALAKTAKTVKLSTG